MTSKHTTGDMKGFIKIYNQVVYSISWVIHASLVIIGLWLIFVQGRIIEGSLLCLVDGVWGIENILFEKFVVKKKLV